MIAWFAFRSPAKIAASVSPINAMKRQSETGFKKRKKNGELFSVQIPVSRTMTIPIPDSYGSWQYDASAPQLQAELLQYLKANGEQS